MTYRPNHPDFTATAQTRTGVTITAKAWGRGSESIRRVEIAGELYDSGEYGRGATQFDVAHDARAAKRYLDSLTRTELEQLISDVMIHPTVGNTLLAAMSTREALPTRSSRV